MPIPAASPGSHTSFVRGGMMQVRPNKSMEHGKRGQYKDTTALLENNDACFRHFAEGHGSIAKQPRSHAWTSDPSRPGEQEGMWLL